MLLSKSAYARHMGGSLRASVSRLKQKKSYCSCDRLPKQKVSPQASKKSPSLEEYGYARTATYEVNGGENTMLISLPADRYKAKDVAALYHLRWGNRGRVQKPEMQSAG